MSLFDFKKPLAMNHGAGQIVDKDDWADEGQGNPYTVVVCCVLTYGEAWEVRFLTAYVRSTSAERAVEAAQDAAPAELLEAGEELVDCRVCYVAEGVQTNLLPDDTATDSEP
jgi:hypothetical protein